MMRLFTIKILTFLATLFYANSLLAVASDHFVTTWQPSFVGGGTYNITIPTKLGLTYNYSIDWDNDGTFDEFNVTGNATHSYGAPIPQTIRIVGNFPRIFINNDTQRLNILSIDQWGTNPWTSMRRAFWGAENLVNNAPDTPNLSNVQHMHAMFRGAINIGTGTGEWGSWDTSAITDMSNMFQTTLFNKYIGLWDTSSVTTFKQMFSGNTAYNRNMNTWNVEASTNFTDMFLAVTLSTSNYEGLLISWANQNINNALSFNGGLSKYCSQAARTARNSLVQGDGLSITDGGLCDEGYFITTWKTDNPGTSSNTSITIPTEATATYAYQVDWNGDGDFNDVDEGTIQTGDATHDYGTIQSSQTINIKGLFPQIFFNDSGDKDKILSIDQWGSNPWSSMNSAFEGASNLINTANDIPNLSNVNSLLQMFYKASSIGSSLDTGNWNWETNNIQTFASMFNNASSFNKDIGNWDTSNAEIFATMFQRASSFNQDISSWSTANVNSMGSMFNNATSFNQDLSGWNFEAASIDFLNFLKDTAFSTNNYDALLIVWDNQSMHTGLILNVGTISYCSQAAVNARANLTTADGWTITDGGHTFACDILFKNSFEEVIIVKTAKQQISYDFSEVKLDTLDQEPHLIVKGMDKNNKENMRIHIRNDLGVLQVRVSYLRGEQWVVQQWFDVDNNKTITLLW